MGLKSMLGRLGLANAGLEVNRNSRRTYQRASWGCAAVTCSTFVCSRKRNNKEVTGLFIHGGGWDSDICFDTQKHHKTGQATARRSHAAKDGGMQVLARGLDSLSIVR